MESVLNLRLLIDYSSSIISDGHFPSVFFFSNLNTVTAPINNPIADKDQDVSMALSHVFCASIQLLVDSLEKEQNNGVAWITSIKLLPEKRKKSIEKSRSQFDIDKRSIFTRSIAPRRNAMKNGR